MKDIEKKAKLVKRAQSSANVMGFDFGSKRATSLAKAPGQGALEVKLAQGIKDRLSNFKKRSLSSNNVALGLQVRKFGSVPAQNDAYGLKKKKTLRQESSNQVNLVN